MSNVATIGSRITGDNVDFIRKIEEAEKRAASFGVKARESFLGIFKRSPHMRAERALGGFVESLASGNIATGIEAISSRMTGMGLVAGLAVGAGVAVFVKFKEQIDAAREAHNALTAEMLKHPLGVVGKLSSEGMEQALEARQKLAEDLRKKSEHTFGRELFEGLKSGIGFSAGDALLKEDHERIQAQKDLNQADQESRQIMEDQVDLQAKIVQIKWQALRGDEHGAEIAKINLETEQQIAALRSKGMPSGAFNRAVTSLEADRSARLMAADKKESDRAAAETHANKLAEKEKGMQNLSFETQKRQLSLETNNRFTDEQKKGLGGALNLIEIKKNLERPELTKNERQNLILKKMKQENELGIMPSTVTPFSGEWWNRKNQGQTKDLNEALGGMGLTQEDINQYGNTQYEGEKDRISDVVDEVSKLNDKMERYWGSGGNQ